MATTGRTKLEERVVKAAEEALADRHFVIDPTARPKIGLVTTKTASLVVMYHLYEKANVYDRFQIERMAMRSLIAK